MNSNYFVCLIITLNNKDMYMGRSIEIEAIVAIGEESRERQNIYQRVAE